VTKKIVVPDTSALIERAVSKLIKEGKLEPEKIVIHNATIAELEHQANENREIGYLGLDEIEELKRLGREFNFSVEFAGERPTAEEIILAKKGEIDNKIRELARKLNAILVTADRTQYRVAKVLGIESIFIEQPRREKLLFEDFFDENTMSIHLKEGMPPLAKKGLPGKWSLVKVRDAPLTRKEMEAILKEIAEEAVIREDSYIDIQGDNIIVAQIGNYRIVGVKPPLSDAIEVTVVRPVKKLKLEDYKLSPELVNRLKEKAHGILIAGAPGMGKTTFAQALAEFYAKLGKVVKTVESPRDMSLGPEITQYSLTQGRLREIYALLLLARPDYVLFDEVRTERDIKLFSDLRLAGIGMIGVIHANRAIDAVQRFIGKIELGVIPQVIDTVIFIDKGKVAKVYTLEMTVKVPTGMTEEDLARPVIEVRDFESGRLEYEIYVFGEETVVMPIHGEKIKETPIVRLARLAIEKEIKRFLKTDEVKVVIDSPTKVTVYVPRGFRKRLVGKKGKVIESFEKLLGVRITVKEFGEELPDFEIKETNKYIILEFPPEFYKRVVRILIDGKPFIDAIVGRDGKVRIAKNSELGKVFLNALKSGSRIDVELK